MKKTETQQRYIVEQWLSVTQYETVMPNEFARSWGISPDALRSWVKKYAEVKVARGLGMFKRHKVF